MATFSINGGEVFYELLGRNGPWVTLINGHTRSSSSDFRSFARYLHDAGLCVAMLDNRGSGKTKTVSEFGFSDLVEDVEELWRIAKITKTALLGISMGGVLAQHLAKRNPNIVTKLVLISTTPEAKFFSEQLPWGTTIDSVKAKLEIYFAADFPKKNRLLLDSMAKQIAAEVGYGGFSEKAEAQLRAMRGHYDTKAFLNNLKVEALVLHGDADRIILPAAAHELAAAICGAKLKMYEGAGHLLLAERAKEMFEDTAEFILGGQSGH